jgi:HK97 family phage prohead protease
MPQAQENEQDDGLFRRSFGIEVNSIDEEKRSGRFVFSSESIDSYGEIVEQSWKLKRYKKNPVILYNHNSRTNSPADSLPIGKAEDVKMVDGCLEGTVIFASEKANPLAEQCWNLFKEGCLRAGSVGFMPGDVRCEKRGGQDTYILSNNELFEFSLTPLPANADAVAKSTNGPRNRDIERLKTLAAKSAALTAPPTSGEGPGDMDPEQLAAEIERLKAESEALNVKAIATEKEATDLRVKYAELQTKFDAQALELKTLTDEKAVLEGKAVNAEVQALVGKKIAPSQVADFIELRIEKGAEKFAAFVSKMTDMVHTTDVIKDTEATAVNTSTGRNKTNSANSAIQKAALEAAAKAQSKFAGDN